MPPSQIITFDSPPTLDLGQRQRLGAASIFEPSDSIRQHLRANFDPIDSNGASFSMYNENNYQSSDSPLHRPPVKPIDSPWVSAENFPLNIRYPSLCAELCNTHETFFEKRCTEKKLESEQRTTGISISHEALKQHFRTKHRDAVVSVGGEYSTTDTSFQAIGTIGTSDGSSESKYSSESTADSHSSLRSTCRKLENSWLPSPKRRKANLTIPDAPDQDVEMVNIKAKFKDEYIVFPLLLSTGMAGLVENVTMRLSRFNVKRGDFKIKYQDSEGDWVLVALDEDLQACMSSLGLVGQSTIRMLVEPINTQ